MKDDDPKWIEKCTRHPAWGRATEDWLENGMAEDHKWQRCVKSGNMDKMDADCWTNILIAYPQS